LARMTRICAALLICSALLGILRGREAEVLAEDGREVGQVREAYGVGHLRDVDLLLLQQAGGQFLTAHSPICDPSHVTSIRHAITC